MHQVLKGVRVLDFGRYIAGPYCAALLAEFGAEVIRIEKRAGGEDRFQAPVTSGGEGGLVMQMNRNKRGMTLDPMKPGAAEVMRRLVATADVVVANLPPQTLAAMKLDYESLTAIKPDIILTTVSAYGRGGPYSDRVGFDVENETPDVIGLDPRQHRVPDNAAAKGGENGEMGDWGEKVEWDAKNLKVTNLSSLSTAGVADLIKPNYAEGHRLD